MKCLFLLFRCLARSQYKSYNLCRTCWIILQNNDLSSGDFTVCFEFIFGTKTKIASPARIFQGTGHASSRQGKLPAESCSQVCSIYLLVHHVVRWHTWKSGFQYWGFNMTDMFVCDRKEEYKLCHFREKKESGFIFESHNKEVSKFLGRVLKGLSETISH